MLKKLPSLILAAAMMAFPAAPASAWERVCMKLPLWKTGYAAKFAVIHGFPAEQGIPTHQELPGTSRNAPLPESLGGDTRNNRSVVARGGVTSGVFAVNQTRCVDITGIAEGTPFIVYVAPEGGHARLCETHRSNPDPWYIQTNRPYSALHYDAWGTTFNPKCKFVYEAR